MRTPLAALAAVLISAPTLFISPTLAQPGDGIDNPALFFAKDRQMQERMEPAAGMPQRFASLETGARSSAPAPVRSGGIDALVAAAAQRHGVPASIARATIRHESGGRCNARGRHGELGPLQIKPSTARGLGYRGPASALATCGAGLEWGMRHLALAYRKCGHIGPHNYGLGGGCQRTAYVRKVMARL